MSLSAVHGTVSSLKSCQTDVGTSMDIVTDVALDLMEAQDGEVSGDITELEAMMVDCARLERDINCFIQVVQQVTEEASSQEPEAMFGLSARVKDTFTRKTAKLSDASLQSHPKVMAFKDSIKSCVGTASQESSANMEELDEDIAVSQSQINFKCPLTQMDMENPVKNKDCNHYYDEKAILGLIKTRLGQQKKCRCPVVGCGNADVKESALVPDQVLRRKIQNQKRSNSRT